MFRLNRNERSHWSGTSVHIGPEMVFREFNFEVQFPIKNQAAFRSSSKPPVAV